MGIVKNRCKNGDYYWVSAYVTPIVENGALTGYESVRVKPSREQDESVHKSFMLACAQAKRPLQGIITVEYSSQDEALPMTAATFAVCASILLPSLAAQAITAVLFLRWAGGRILIRENFFTGSFKVFPMHFQILFSALTYSDSYGPSARLENDIDQ